MKTITKIKRRIRSLIRKTRRNIGKKIAGRGRRFKGPGRTGLGGFGKQEWKVKAHYRRAHMRGKAAVAAAE